MVRIVNGDIEVLYEWGLPFGPTPRLVLGAVGVVMVASALLLLLVEFVRTEASAPPANERLAVCGLLLITGVALVFRAALLKARHLASVIIGDAGITFCWKGSRPGPRAVAGERTFVGWDSMESIEWTEEGLEHEFKQYLSVTLRAPILHHNRRYRFLICDTRSQRECRALNAKIPPQARRPSSVLAVLQQG